MLIADTAYVLLATLTQAKFMANTLACYGYLYPSTQAPQVRKEFYLCFAMSAAPVQLACKHHVIKRRIDRARHRNFGKVRRGENFDISEMVDASAGYRFTA